ncbi:MAG: hypothetical protein JWQ74_3565 [Marmoricola sp.]|nr:hypothetical protein [Marmoricola sp.]
MNKIVTAERNAASSVAFSQSGNSSYLQVESLGDIVRFAELMCQSKAGIPQYLHGNAPDCMAITMQALQWGMNPFSVAQKSYKIKDVIAYEAQLIAAVINTRADLKKRPQISFECDGPKRKCTVTFEFNDGTVQIYVSPEFEKITPKNSPLWKSDPDQQQSYYSMRAGGRRYCPEVILGVYDRDEVEDFRGPNGPRDVTPAPSVMERLQAARAAPEQAAGEREGFSAEHVNRETANVLTGEIIEFADPGDGTPSSTPDAGEDASSMAPEPGVNPPQTSSSGSEQSPRSFAFGADEVVHLRDFARKALDDAAGPNDAPAKEVAIDRMRFNYLDAVNSADARAAIAAMEIPLAAVINGKRTRAQAADFIARDILGCEPAELEGRS